MPDRHVDEEDPAPTDVRHDQPAEHRPQCRGSQRRDHDHRRRPGSLRRWERPEQHGQPDRRQHAAADALDDSEGDQLTDRLRRAAQQRSARECHRARTGTCAWCRSGRRASPTSGSTRRGSACSRARPTRRSRSAARDRATGMATLTMVVSRMSRNNAETYTIATTHL